MKYLVFIIVLLNSLRCYSQSEPDYPLISFGCGEAGIESESVQQISYLLNTDNYDSLRTFLNSSDASLKYLSIKACEYRVKKKKFIFTSQDKIIIASAKQSVEKIEYCSGCTFQQEYSLKELFEDDSIDLNKSLVYWIRRFDK